MELRDGADVPVPIPLSYVGPGGTVARLTLDPLDSVLSYGDVLPLRLPGIHLDDRAFLVALEASRESVERAWRFLEGHVEWSVQVCGHAQALVVDAYATLSREATASAVLGPHDIRTWPSPRPGGRGFEPP